MKKVIIIGASTGIGYAVAETLASRQVKVGLASRNTAPLKELQSKYPDFVEFIDIDITKPEATDRLKLLIERTGGMDIYFHVAGIGYSNESLDPEREVQIIETNSCGFARMLSAAYRWMRDNGVRGQIAAITSIAGTKGIGCMSAYSSSKKFAHTYITALEQLSHLEHANISFTDIRPGWVRTPLLKQDMKYPLEMSLKEIVPQILHAIVKRKRVAVLDRRWAALSAIWQLIPNKLWVYLPIKTGI